MTTLIKTKQGIANNHIPLFFLLLLMAICTPINELQAQENIADKTGPIVIGEIIDTILTLDPVTYEQSMEIIKQDLYFRGDKMPCFPGCDTELEGLELQTCCQSKMLEYIFSNIKYPDLARENNTQGMVVAQFNIFTDGSIGAINIIKSLGDGCDEEVIRVISTMPNWQPGEVNSKPVIIQFNLPIPFRLRSK